MGGTDSEVVLPEWASEACMMGIDEAGRGPVLGPMVYGCLYCAVSFQKTLASLEFADAEVYCYTVYKHVKYPRSGTSYALAIHGQLSLPVRHFIRVIQKLDYKRCKVYGGEKGTARYKCTMCGEDSKTLKEGKREELFEALKANDSIGWAVDVIDPRELSAKMLKKNKINLNEISHDSAIGLVTTVLSMGVLLTQVYVDTVGDPEKYQTKLSERFPSIKFVVAKKADSLYPVVSGASIVAKVTRDRALRSWTFDESAENMHRNFGSGYPGDPETKAWLEHHKQSVFGFPTLVRFSWGTCTTYFKDGVEVIWDSDDALDENGVANKNGKRQLKLSSLGFTGSKKSSEEIESSGKGRCKFFQTRKLEQLTQF